MKNFAARLALAAGIVSIPFILNRFLISYQLTKLEKELDEQTKRMNEWDPMAQLIEKHPWLTEGFPVNP